MSSGADDFLVTLAPGHFSDDPHAEWAAECKRTHVLLPTEATSHRFDVPGWVSSQGPGRQGESFAAVGPRFRVIAPFTEQITSGRGKGRFSEPTYVSGLICEDTWTKRMVIFIGAHLRAHLWPGSKHYERGNVRTWIEGVRGIRRLIRRLRRRYRHAAIMVGGDPNATHKGWFLRQIRRRLPNARVAWAGAFSSAILWGLKVTHVTTLDPGDASDHPWKRMRVHYRGNAGLNPTHTPDR